MSHELRTPLNAVLGFAQLGQGQAQADRERRHFGLIHDSGEHLLHLINEILDFSSIEAGKLRIAQEPFAIAELVDGVVSMVRPAAESKSVALRVRNGCGPSLCLAGDGHRLAQVLANLLSNAVKFTSRGHVELAVEHDGERLSCVVEDTGIGISAEQLERLFRPFEQADASTRRRFGGTGLGLAISKRLAEAMGGSLQADSTPGRGSRFRLDLPLRATLDHPTAIAIPSGLVL